MYGLPESNTQFHLPEMLLPLPSLVSQASTASAFPILGEKTGILTSLHRDCQGQKTKWGRLLGTLGFVTVYMVLWQIPPHKLGKNVH